MPTQYLLNPPNNWMHLLILLLFAMVPLTVLSLHLASKLVDGDLTLLVLPHELLLELNYTLILSFVLVEFLLEDSDVFLVPVLD